MPACLGSPSGLACGLTTVYPTRPRQRAPLAKGTGSVLVLGRDLGDSQGWENGLRYSTSAVDYSIMGIGAFMVTGMLIGTAFL